MTIAGSIVEILGTLMFLCGVLAAILYDLIDGSAKIKGAGGRILFLMLFGGLLCIIASETRKQHDDKHTQTNCVCECEGIEK